MLAHVHLILEITTLVETLHNSIILRLRPQMSLIHLDFTSGRRLLLSISLQLLLSGPLNQLDLRSHTSLRLLLLEHLLLVHQQLLLL